ncbi:hypothetical protein [Lichenicola sp.]|uniref:hypothetical protein n=1 Tax=Lichenicola sp. TaxID=2804529 RepID=UPI003AFF854A
MVDELVDEDRGLETEQVEQIAAMGQIPNFVFNSVITSCSATEVMAVVRLGGRPLQLMIMSPPMAKTLAVALMARVADYERITGAPVLTAEEVSKKNLGS